MDWKWQDWNLEPGTWNLEQNWNLEPGGHLCQGAVDKAEAGAGAEAGAQEPVGGLLVGEMDRSRGGGGGPKAGRTGSWLDWKWPPLMSAIHQVSGSYQSSQGAVDKLQDASCILSNRWPLTIIITELFVLGLARTGFSSGNGQLYVFCGHGLELWAFYGLIFISLFHFFFWCCGHELCVFLFPFLWNFLWPVWSSSFSFF